MKDFKAGDRVVLNDRALKVYNEYENDVYRGTVLETKADTLFTMKVLVKWDSKWSNPNPREVSADELLTEAEGDAIHSKLEEEYNSWALPVQEKMKEAARLLREADKLTSEHNRDLAVMHDLIAPLVGAMDDMGWRTSSLSC